MGVLIMHALRDCLITEFVVFVIVAVAGSYDANAGDVVEPLP